MLLPIATLWSRELTRFWREKSRVFGFVGSPLVFWLLIGSGFGEVRFFFPGMLVLRVLFSGVFSSMSLIEDRREGFLLSMLVSPAPRTAMVLGKVLGSATLAWLQGLVFLALGSVLGGRLALLQALDVAAFLFLISFTFTSLGFLFAWKMDSTQGFHAVINLLLFPMWMVSGALFPMATAHGWMQWLMRINPLTYSLAGLRQLLESGVDPMTPAFGTSLLITTVTAIVLLIISIAMANQRQRQVST
jgi:ABC-2 type transport system permease protein